MAFTRLTPGNATAGNAVLASDHSAAFTNINELYDSQRMLGSRTRTTSITQAATAEQEVFASDLTITTVNGVTYRAEFYCPNAVAAAGGYGVFKLTNGSGTVITRMGTFGNVAVETPLHFVVYFTASSTSTTLNVLFRSEGAGSIVIRGDTGSGDVQPPIFLRVFGPDYS